MLLKNRYFLYEKNLKKIIAFDYSIIEVLAKIMNFRKSSAIFCVCVCVLVPLIKKGLILGIFWVYNQNQINDFLRPKLYLYPQLSKLVRRKVDDI